jgi:DNA segregation ATPase FtsK/SpoIIIE, S-DNA-T family
VEVTIVSEVPFDGEDEDGLLDDEPGAEIVPFPAAASAGVAVKSDKYAAGDWKPVVPEHLRTREGRKKAAGWQVKRAKHHSAYHGIRSPLYLALMVAWAAFGLSKVLYVQMRWAWVAEQTYLRHKAVEDGKAGEWTTLHKHAREVRAFRFTVLAAEAAVLAYGVARVDEVTVWLWVPLGLPLAALLAWLGRPSGKPIVGPSVVPVVVAKLTVSLIVRALGVLGIPEMNKALRDEPETAIATIDGPTRDGAGWLWKGELPPGVTAGQVSEKREELASGLRRPLGCVWPETDHKRHPGALDLYVADEDMTKADQPLWPLLKRGVVDLFMPQPFAYDPRGRAVSVVLMFVSGIIGSIPRMGKTFLLRLLLLICALDPRAEIHAYDLKGTGDLAPLRPVCHRYRAGEEDEDIAYLYDDCLELKTELRRRTKLINHIGETDPERCPENKVTPELASDPALGLHPVVIGLDECQKAFEHPLYGPLIQPIVEDLVRMGPAVGMITLLATQRPDRNSIPTPISANAVMRWCLKVMGQVENDMILGTSQYKAGIRATMFTFDDKGVFYFGGEGVRPRIMRAQKIDNPTARLIVARARRVRERLGRITGYALGEDFSRAVNSFLGDVLEVFGDDKNLWTETIAARLKESVSETYADITQEAVASQLRNLGVEVKTVREARKGGKSGCTKDAVQTANALRNP